MIRLSKPPLYSLLFCLFIFAFSCGCNKKIDPQTGNQGTGKTTTPKTGKLSDLEEQLASQKLTEISNQTIDLKGKKIIVRNTLKLGQNAVIRNGTLHGANGKIIAPQVLCLKGVTISGKWQKTTGYMEWFTDGKESNNNFLALSNLIALNAEVLLDKMYSLSTSQTFQSTNDILVKGSNKNKAGFILTNTLRKKLGYFSSADGNNIHLENITLQASPKGKIKATSNFVFASCFNVPGNETVNPKMDYFKLINCNINGAVSFAYGSSKSITDLDFFKSLGVKNIEIRGCTIKGIQTLITLKGAPYQDVVIADNIISDISGPAFFFPINSVKLKTPLITYDLRESMVIKNNVLRNTKINTQAGSSYIALIVAKGKNFRLENNTIENLISKIAGCETVPFYCSASEKVIIHKNTSRNCFNIDQLTPKSKKLRENTLLKLKGSLNAEITDNNFSIDQEALVRAGVIPKNSVALSKIQATLFRINLIDSAGKSRKKENKYVFRNNTFSTPYLNDYSTIARQSFIFENNTINIGYMDSPPKDRWGDGGHNLDHTLFYMRGKDNNNRISFSGNTINVDQMRGKELKITGNPISNKEYKEVELIDNKINVKGRATFYQPKSKKIQVKRNKGM